MADGGSGRWAYCALFSVTSRCSGHVEFGPGSVNAGAHTSGLRRTLRVAFRFQGITAWRVIGGGPCLAGVRPGRPRRSAASWQGRPGRRFPRGGPPVEPVRIAVRARGTAAAPPAPPGWAESTVAHRRVVQPAARPVGFHLPGSGQMRHR